MRVKCVLFISIVAVVITATIFCTRSCESKKAIVSQKSGVNTKLDSIEKEKIDFNRIADSLVLQRTNIQIKYKTKIKIEHEKINSVDSLPICAVADSIAKYYKPPDR